MQVNLVPISKEFFPQYSILAFHDDIDMQTKYGTIVVGETPAERNVRNVREADEQYPLNYYKVELEKRVGDIEADKIVSEKTDIGFVVIAKVGKEKWLYSFGINIEYRQGDILKAWMDKMDALLGRNYKVLLFLKNTRAIQFFTKNGFVNNQVNEEFKGILMWR